MGYPWFLGTNFKLSCKSKLMPIQRNRNDYLKCWKKQPSWYPGSWFSQYVMWGIAFRVLTARQEKVKGVQQAFPFQNLLSDPHSNGMGLRTVENIKWPKKLLENPVSPTSILTLVHHGQQSCAGSDFSEQMILKFMKAAQMGCVNLTFINKFTCVILLRPFMERRSIQREAISELKLRSDKEQKCETERESVKRVGQKQILMKETVKDKIHRSQVQVHLKKLRGI